MGYDISKTSEENLIETKRYNHNFFKEVSTKKNNTLIVEQIVGPAPFEMTSNDAPREEPDNILYPERCRYPRNAVSWPENCELLDPTEKVESNNFCAYAVLTGGEPGKNSKTITNVLLPSHTEIQFYDSEKLEKDIQHFVVTMKMSKEDEERFRNETKWMFNYTEGNPYPIKSFKLSGETWAYSYVTSFKNYDAGKQFTRTYPSGQFCVAKDGGNCIKYYPVRNCKDIRDAVEKFADDWAAPMLWIAFGAFIAASLFCGGCTIPISVEIGVFLAPSLLMAYSNYKKGNMDGAVVDVLFAFWPALKYMNSFRGIKITEAAWKEVQTVYMHYGSEILTNPQLAKTLYMESLSPTARQIFKKLLLSDDVTRNMMYADLKVLIEGFNKTQFRAINNKMTKGILDLRKQMKSGGKIRWKQGNLPIGPERIALKEQLWLRDLSGLPAQMTFAMILDVIFPYSKGSQLDFGGEEQTMLIKQIAASSFMLGMDMSGLQPDGWAKLPKENAIKLAKNEIASKNDGYYGDFEYNEEEEMFDPKRYLTETPRETLSDKELQNLWKDGWFEARIVSKTDPENFDKKFNYGVQRIINGSPFVKMNDNYFKDKKFLKEFQSLVMQKAENIKAEFAINYEDYNPSYIENYSELSDEFREFAISESLKNDTDFTPVAPGYGESMSKAGFFVVYSQPDGMWYKNKTIQRDKKSEAYMIDKDLSKSAYWIKIESKELYYYYKQNYTLLFNDEDQNWYRTKSNQNVQIIDPSNESSN